MKTGASARGGRVQIDTQRRALMRDTGRVARPFRVQYGGVVACGVVCPNEWCFLGGFSPTLLLPGESGRVRWGDVAWWSGRRLRRFMCDLLHIGALTLCTPNSQLYTNTNTNSDTV